MAAILFVALFAMGVAMNDCSVQPPRDAHAIPGPKRELYVVDAHTGECLWIAGMTQGTPLFASLRIYQVAPEHCGAAHARAK